MTDIDAKVWKDVPIFIDTFRPSPLANKFQFSPKRSTHKIGEFESPALKTLKGAFETEFQISGFAAGGLDFEMLKTTAGDDAVPVGAVVVSGALALFGLAHLAQHQTGGEHDSPAVFDQSGNFTGPAISGRVLHSSVGTSPAAITGAGDGAAIELGPLGAGFELHLWLWVGGPEGVEAGTVLQAPVIESAPAADFAVPQVIHTFADVDAEVVARHIVDGDTTPNSDTFYRVRFPGVTGAGAAFFPIVLIAITKK